jgi:hypothetical protein
MKIYVNSEGVIYDVGENTTGEELTELEINDNGNPFNGWSKGKICCYKVAVENGVVTMMTPAVDSRIIRNFDAVSPKTYTKTAYIEDTECIFTGVPSGNMTIFCPVNYTVERMDGRVTVYFEPLEEVINITISVI